MINTEEIVFLFEHKITNFRESAEILKKLNEANIQIFVAAEYAYAGIPDGGKIFMSILLRRVLRVLKAQRVNDALESGSLEDFLLEFFTEFSNMPAFSLLSVNQQP